MSNQEPDGWCAWHPSEGWSHMIYRSPMDRSKFGPSYDTKWETKPICLIDPQELSRLRAISELVVRALDEFGSTRLKDEEDLNEILLELYSEYQAITAPVEDK